jgi:hypothetical protein
MESAGLLGSIAGIAEMTRDAISGQSAHATTRDVVRPAAGTVPNVAPPGRPAGT